MKKTLIAICILSALAFSFGEKPKQFDDSLLQKQIKELTNKQNQLIKENQAQADDIEALAAVLAQHRDVIVENADLLDKVNRESIKDIQIAR